MDASTLQYLIEHWDDVSVGLLLFLFIAGVLWLFFTDRLSSPKTVKKLRDDIASRDDDIAALEAKCAAIDQRVGVAAQELTDARILYAAAAVRIEFLEADKARLSMEATECRQRLDRAQLEADVRRHAPHPHEGSMS